MKKLFDFCSRVQVPFALSIYFYAALSSSAGASSSLFGPTILHIIGNILLSLSLLIGFRDYINVKFVALISVVLATLVETLQILNPNRTPDIQDFIANYLGLIIGFGLYYLGIKNIFLSLLEDKKNKLN